MKLQKKYFIGGSKGGRGSHQNADCVQFSGAGANEVMEGFEMNGFPRVIGAMDGCQIQIKTPQDLYHPMSYLNMKKNYSVILQVCLKKTNKNKK